MTFRTSILPVVLLLISSITFAQTAPQPVTSNTNSTTPTVVIKLWPNGAPGAVGTTPDDVPTLTLWRPTETDRAHASRTAMIVVPGGAYLHLADNHEGRQVANWLNAMGVTVFLLEYRLSPRYRWPAPLEDMQRAIRIVRSRAAEFGFDPDRIGVMGFSAGGHLCSMAGTHFDQGNASAADPVDQASDRPDFMVLGYPVISFTAWMAKSRSLVLQILPKGEDPEKGATELSSEFAVTPRTPPAFLFSTSGDDYIPAEQHAVPFYIALRKAHVPAELHVFEKGPHGVGLDLGDPVLSEWTVALRNWLWQNGWLTPPRATAGQ